MMRNVNELRDSVSDLYWKVDRCIHDIVLSRLHKDTEKEHLAIMQMEFLLSDTMQDLSCVLNFIDAAKIERENTQKALDGIIQLIGDTDNDLLLEIKDICYKEINDLA